MTNSFTISRIDVLGADASEAKEEIPDMALLDVLTNANFRTEQVGRVVIFPGASRHQGYLVKSVGEELRIRSFLKMFYGAQLAIALLGYLLASEWSRDLIYSLGRPSAFLYRTVGIVLGTLFFVVGIPSWLLWRSYKKALLNFVSIQDQVVLSRKSASRSLWLVGVGLIALAILMSLVAKIWIRAH